MNALLVALMLSQISPPPLVQAEDLSVRRPAQGRGRPVPLEPSVVLRSSEPQPEPEQRRLWELAGPGAAFALGGYVASWVVLFDSISCRGSWFSRCDSASILLLIPQLGPWMSIVTNGPADPWFGYNLALGFAQTGGLLAMITGMIVKVPVGSEGAVVSVMPTGNGMALSGSF